ncbi:MAG: FtsX-like permease family protein [Blastocatellia bacterium]
MSLVLRTKVAPLSLAETVRRRVLAADKDQPVARTQTMDTVIASSIADRRFTMLLLGVFAAVALLLAAIGIYSVMAYTVTQRTQEIGIRLALGAQRRDVLRLVLRQGLTLTVVGLGLGLAGALALTHLMSDLLFGVSATDPLTFTLIAALLTSVALVACWIPARRATKVDPMIALRCE